MMSTTDVNRIEGDPSNNIGGRPTPAGAWRTRHVAEHLGVHEQTVNRWRRTPKDGPPFRRMSGGRFGRVLYDPEHVRRWVAGEIERGPDGRPVELSG